MTCKYLQSNKCQLIIEWQPDRFLDVKICNSLCRTRFGGNHDKLIAWAKAKKNGRATKDILHKRECKRICNKCEPIAHCALKKKRRCKRGDRGFFCKENKWPVAPWGEI